MASEPTAADVQEELQDYLNSKNINSLFIQIVERLLIEKPDNPIAFMIEYLQKTYPDQANVSNAAMNPAPTENDANDSENSDSDDEDDYDDSTDVRFAKIKPRGRRASVSAECGDPSKLQVDLKKVPKSEEETKRIMEILHSNHFFKHLDNDQMESVKDCMVAREGPSGDYIIKQGDDGDNFYVVDSGSMDVFKKVGDAPEKKVWNYEAGDSFGELAIMYNAPRAASIKATSAYKCWALDRVSFKAILMKAAMNKRSTHKGFLSEVPILESLDDYEKSTIADALVEEVFEAGDVICRQGEPGEKFYIVKDGIAICTKKDATGVDVECARLKPGMYFGEIALMTTKQRQATVSCADKLTVLSLDRKTFKRVMGPIEEVLKRNIELYNKVQAKNI